MLRYRYGQWSYEISEQSSHYRELRNLVDKIQKLCHENHLKHCELFLFTDNLEVDYAYHKGTSSSKLLFGLALRLRKLQIQGDLILYLVHISGERMREYSIDALLKSFPTEGFIEGEKMLLFLPLHKSAVKRSGGFLSWIRSWWSKEKVMVF